eukprot:1803545-Rhodomonas_salina.1
MHAASCSDQRAQRNDLGGGFRVQDALSSRLQDHRLARGVHGREPTDSLWYLGCAVDYAIKVQVGLASGISWHSPGSGHRPPP